jgi:hypothetical protein
MEITDMPIDDETVREIANLRQHFETIIKSNEDRSDERMIADREALRVALQANEKRLDGMNEFRQALSDQANRMMPRSEVEAIRNTIVDKSELTTETFEKKYDSEIKAMMTKIDEIRKPNWPLMASVVSLFLMMVTGVWLVIGLKIDSTLSPLALDVQDIKVGRASTNERLSAAIAESAASSQADTASKADRAQLNERMHSLETARLVNTTDIAQISQSLVEIETQFCSSDIVRNLMHSTDERTQAILWHRIFPDTTMPTDNSYYPQVCNRVTPTIKHN